jgi:hypothetical protein
LCTCNDSPNWMADPSKFAETPPGLCSREKCCQCQTNFLQPYICQRDKCEGPGNLFPKPPVNPNRCPGRYNCEENNPSHSPSTSSSPSSTPTPTVRPENLSHKQIYC